MTNACHQSSLMCPTKQTPREHSRSGVFAKHPASQCRRRDGYCCAPPCYWHKWQTVCNTMAFHLHVVVDGLPACFIIHRHSPPHSITSPPHAS